MFAFTALLDPILNLVGLFTSSLPVYAVVLFLDSAIASLWLAFTNAFNLGRITFAGALGSFLPGNAIELFFNYTYYWDGYSCFSISFVSGWERGCCNIGNAGSFRTRLGQDFYG